MSDTLQRVSDIEEPVYEVRVDGHLVTQKEIDRQSHVTPRPRLPHGVGRYAQLEHAVTLFGWCARQYRDQEASIVGSWAERERRIRARGDELEDDAEKKGRAWAQLARDNALGEATDIARENGVRTPSASLVREIERKS